ncbi:MAG TPA: hypothetical protein VGL11_21465 [Candidatus Binatia bacterium]|jgi:hypothetical protein
MADRQTPGTYKRKMQLWVSAALAACILFFALLYLPDEVLSPIFEKIKTVNELLVKTGLAVPFVVIFPWILFSQDHLATGNSRASVFFRHYYPSSYAVEVKGLPRDKANSLWFDYFNLWENDKHPHNEYYRRNFERTYGCRLIFYLKRILGVFIVLAVLTTVLTTWVFETKDSARLLPARIGVLIVSIIVLASLQWSNRIGKQKRARSYEDSYLPTGAYFKYKEIAGIMHTLFEKDVLSKTKR